MIHFYVGKPRSGKSLLAAFRLIEFLKQPGAFVLTNMAIRHAELQDELDRQGIECHAIDAVRLLNDDEAKEFYLHMQYHSLRTDSRQATVDYSPVFADQRYYVDGRTHKEDGSPNPLRPVLYLIDEVQNLFPARSWSTEAGAVTFHLTQHGKLNQTIIFICQAVSHVTKNFRDLAQDFTYCRNHRIEKFRFFRGEDCFTAKTYYSPNPNMPGIVPAETKTYKLDLRVARIYDTSAGVGMPGGGLADNGKRAKGIPMSIIWVFCGLGVAAVYVGATYLLPYMGDHLIPATVGANSSPKPSLTPAPIPEQPSHSLPSVTLRNRDDSPDPQPLKRDVRTVKGWAILGNRVIVELVSGERIPSRWIESIDSSGVTLRNGEFLPMSQPLLTYRPIGPLEPRTTQVVASPAAAPVSRDMGSWVLGEDGVSRLKDAGTLTGTSIATRPSRVQ